MYDVPKHVLPEGYTYASYINGLMEDIRNGKDVEKNTTLIFELTYPFATIELNKYSNIDDVSEMIPDMSIAFMKTIHSYDNNASSVSFLNYYKTSIRNEIFMTRYKHRHDPEHRISYKQMANSMVRLDAPLVDPKGFESYELIEVVEDERVNLEAHAEYMDLVDAIHRAIDKMFKHSTSRNRERDKEMFTTYIDSIIIGEDVTQAELGVKYGHSRSHINRLLNKYKNRLENILKAEGYLI